MSGHVGNLSPEQQQALDKMKDKLNTIEPPLLEYPLLLCYHAYYPVVWCCSSMSFVASLKSSVFIPSILLIPYIFSHLTLFMLSYYVLHTLFTLILVRIKKQVMDDPVFLRFLRARQFDFDKTYGILSVSNLIYMVILNLIELFLIIVINDTQYAQV